jgi:hypothetical protein
VAVAVGTDGITVAGLRYIYTVSGIIPTPVPIALNLTSVVVVLNVIDVPVEDDNVSPESEVQDHDDTSGLLTLTVVVAYWQIEAVSPDASSCTKAVSPVTDQPDDVDKSAGKKSDPLSTYVKLIIVLSPGAMLALLKTIPIPTSPL